MGSRRGDSGAYRDLGRRLRVARHRAKGRAVEAGGSGRLSRWTGGPIPEEGLTLGEHIGAEQSKGGGWESSQDTEGDG